MHFFFLFLRTLRPVAESLRSFRVTTPPKVADGWTESVLYNDEALFSKNEKSKSKISRNASNHMKYSRVGIGEKIVTDFDDNFEQNVELWNLRICYFPQFSFLKTFNSNTSLFENFENRFIQFLFGYIDVFTSILYRYFYFRFFGNDSFKNCVQILRNFYYTLHMNGWSSKVINILNEFVHFELNIKY